MPRRSAGMVSHEPPPRRARGRRGSTVVPATLAEAEKAETKARRGASSVRYAWKAVTALEPELVPDAIRRGLKSTSGSVRLGYLELGAKVMKEIGSGQEQGGGVAVIVVGPQAENIQAYRRAAAAIGAAGEGA